MQGGAICNFSLELDEDQLQIVKWVHEFTENVVRPAGPEWDEREETQWPIIQEAAKNGLYSFNSSRSASRTRPVFYVPHRRGDELG